MKNIRSRRRNRATALLEFVLIFPMFMFLLFFILDMGRLMMVNGAVQDATYRAARAGATVGGGELPGRRVSNDAFFQAMGEVPGGSTVRNARVTVVRGSICTQGSPYVEVRADYTIRLLTPGLNTMLDIAAPRNTANIPGQFNLRATAVARCEVAQ